MRADDAALAIPGNGLPPPMQKRVNSQLCAAESERRMHAPNVTLAEYQNQSLTHTEEHVWYPFHRRCRSEHGTPVPTKTFRRRPDTIRKLLSWY